MTPVEIQKILGVPFSTWFPATVEPCYDKDSGAILRGDKEGLYQAFVDLGKESVTLLLNLDHAGLMYSTTRRVYLPQIMLMRSPCAFHQAWCIEVGAARLGLLAASLGKINEKV